MAAKIVKEIAIIILFLTFAGKSLLFPFMISAKLIRSSLVYTVIGALPLISSFFLLIFYTNYLTRDDYGALVIYISFTALIQILISFGLDAYIGISYHDLKNKPEQLLRRIGVISGYLMIWGLFLVLGSLLLGESVFTLAFRKKDIFFFPYGFMSMVTAFCNSYFKTYTSLLINQEKPGQFAVANLANFIMTIAFSLTGLFIFPFTLIGPMWGRLLSGIGIFIIAFFSMNKTARIKIIRGDELKQAFRFSFPVLIFFMLSWVISSIYPFIMKYFMTLTDIAIFGLAMQFTLLVEFVLNGMSSSISPRAYSIIREKNLTGTTPELNKYFSSFNAISLLVIAGSSFFIPLVLPLLINKDYAASFLFLSALNIGFATRGTYYYFLIPIYLFKKTKVLPGTYTVTAIVQVVISILLIKMYGIWGAVAANVITKIVQSFLLWLAVKNIFTFRFNILKFIGLPLVVTILILASEYLFRQTNLNLLRFGQMVITSALVFLVYRRETAELFRSLIKKWRISRIGV